MEGKATSAPGRRRNGKGAGNDLGARLRETRKGSRLPLREMERRTGVNSGYLSQLERGKVSQPTPAVLRKVAGGYRIPLHVLMRWVGYVGEGDGLSPNQARALSYLGDDPSNEEVEVIRAVLDALRQDRGALGVPGYADHHLGADDLHC